MLPSAASASPEKTTHVTDALLKQVAGQWKKESDAGKVKLNDPSQVPKLPHETTAPSNGKKHYSPNKETTSSSPSPATTLAAATPPPPGYTVFNIALVNNGSSWSPTQLDSYATAMQDALNTQHVYKWSVAADIKPYGSVAEWQNSATPSWPVFVDGNCPDCEGGAYHDATTVNGVCLAYSEIQDSPNDLDYTENSVSHETFEMIDNPFCGGIDRVVKYGNALWLVESADPVEDYSYPLDGHVITNWQFPSYWQLGASGALNEMGLTQTPLYPVCGPDYDTSGDPGTNYQVWERSQRDSYKAYNCIAQPVSA